MQPVYDKSGVRIFQGHCLDVLRSLPDGCVQTCVTSPPYWGLRDYGIEPVVWGGDAECEHEWGEWQEKHDVREETKSGKTRTTDRHYGAESRKFDGNHQKHSHGAFCRHCSAWLGCFGLEPTLELYVEHAVEIFREVRRVLRDDGTLFLNLGDSYCTSPRGNRDGDLSTSSLTNPQRQEALWGKHAYRNQEREPRLAKNSGLKHKDLCGIPWRVAFALQADGWYLRSDIIWHKPNPMPESVTDRPTRAHEYVFLMSKSARYYYDQEATREKLSDSTLQRRGSGGSRFDGHDEYFTKRDGGRKHIGQLGETGLPPKGSRNSRTVWSVTTQPYKKAHFATFPPKLIEPMILAGSPEGGTVLDPFGGSGTTGQVAMKNGRKCILIEANAEYVELCKERLQQPVLF